MAEAAKKKKPVDMQAVLNRLKEQSKRGEGSDRSYIKFEEGDNRVRLLPGHPNMDAFFVEVYYHTRQGRNDQTKVRCLNNGDMDGDDCPVCEELRALRGSRDKGDKKLLGEQRPKNRFFMNAIDRRDETPEAKILACGTQIMTQILGYVTDPDYGDITDVNEGLDIVINRTGEKLDTEYTVKPRRKSTPLFEDDDDITALIGTNAKNTKLNDLTELANQFDGEPDNIAYIWENGWDKFKKKMESEKDDDEDSKPKKKSKKPVEDEEDEEEEEEAPKPKKKIKMTVEEEDEDGPVPLKKKKPVKVEEEDEDEEDDDIPTPPKKAKKNKPEPEEEDEEEEDEPPVKAKKKAKKPAEDEDDDEDLASLDEALSRAKNKTKKGK